MIELPILGLLKYGPMHGYELKQRLENITGYFGTASYGSLYPMLRKLEERGHVSNAVQEQAGRKRIVYQITPEGEARFRELMRDPGMPFTLKMLFFESIPSLDRRQLLEQQRDEWVAKLAERRRNQKVIAGHPVGRFQVALLARAIAQLERDIPWIEVLIAGENEYDEVPLDYAGAH